MWNNEERTIAYKKAKALERIADNLEKVVESLTELKNGGICGNSEIQYRRLKAEVDMKRCTSVFFFFDDDDITFKDMILSEAKERGYKVTTKQYSRQGEATIITPNTSNNSISLRAWKLVYDEHKNKKERR